MKILKFIATLASPKKKKNFATLKKKSNIIRQGQWTKNRRTLPTSFTYRYVIIFSFSYFPKNYLKFSVINCFMYYVLLEILLNINT